MATVSVLQPTPVHARQTIDMAARRQPLAQVPNAINSPFRKDVPNGTANGKRGRAHLGQDAGEPPHKKQIIVISDREDEENVDPRRRQGIAAANAMLDEPFSKRSTAPQTSLTRRLAAVQEKKHASTHSQQSKERPQKVHGGDNIETIRQWQRHYRKQFPSFVIYFDSVPEETRVKTLRQIQSLGAHEAKFFSKQVTHVVTTRTIPPELTDTSPDAEGKYDVNQARPVAANAVTGQARTASLLDATLQRRGQGGVQNAAGVELELRRGQNQNADILTRARQLGIKIWALEKLNRMLKTMLETDPGDEVAAHGTRTHTTASRATSRTAKDADLEQLLRNEKINGPADRDMTAPTQDMCTFHGLYIYIHDMDEKTKPVMVRDYPKPSDKHDSGKWPQFRDSGPGRCPFVEDPQQAKRQQVAARAQEELLVAQRKSRAASTQQAAAPRPLAPPRALTERNANLRRSPRKLDAKQDGIAKPLDPLPAPPAKRQSSTTEMPNPALFNSAQASLRGLPRMIGGEPAASGIQPSNVTSAIRSQYISSAAISSTALGANHRVGDSKEVSALKRKVLERGASVQSNASMPSSHMNEIRAAINGGDHEHPPRAAKRKAQENLLGVVHEEEEGGAGQRAAKVARKTTRLAAVKRTTSKPAERDPKPGYCENCRDKYEDFDEVGLLRHMVDALIVLTSRVACPLSQAPEVRNHERELERTRSVALRAQAAASGSLGRPRCHISTCDNTPVVSTSPLPLGVTWADHLARHYTILLLLFRTD